jgi:hypothetical protein
MILVPNVALLKILELIFKDTSPVNQTLRLFTNDLTPDEDTVLTDFIEMSGLSYAVITLTRSEWTAALSGGVPTIENLEKTFTFTQGTPATIYGYYVTFNDGSDRLLYCERFDGPSTVGATGDDTIKIVPKVTQKTEILV